MISKRNARNRRDYGLGRILTTDKRVYFEKEEGDRELEILNILERLFYFPF